MFEEEVKSFEENLIRLFYYLLETSNRFVTQYDDGWVMDVFRGARWLASDDAIWWQVATLIANNKIDFKVAASILWLSFIAIVLCYTHTILLSILCLSIIAKFFFKFQFY